jgi:hypothetical protein
MTTRAAPPTKKPDANCPLSPWIKSKAKAKLCSLLLDESLWIQICSLEQIHAADDDFNQNQSHNSKPTSTISSPQSATLNRRYVLFDKAAVVNQKERFPRNPTTE